MKSVFEHFAGRVQDYLWQKKNPPAAAVSQGERVPLGEVQRRLGIYLRALWGCEFILRPLPAEGPQRPGIAQGSIGLPANCGDLTGADGNPVAALDVYRAAATHAAAHLMYTLEQFPEASADPWQRAVVGVIEDARVETLAMRRFPRLQQLWCAQHTATPARHTNAGDYLDRLARALLDEHYRDDDAWVSRGRAMFRAAQDMQAQSLSLEIGMQLAQAFADKHIRFRPRVEPWGALYRDDNRCLWQAPQINSGEAEEMPDALLKAWGALLESDEVVIVDAHDKRTKHAPTRMGQSGKAVSPPYGYPEWDYQSQTQTPSWVTLREILPRSGELRIIDDIVTQHQHLIVRMKALLNAIRHGGVRRIRKLEEGDEIDVNAAIRARVDARMGRQPDPRIMMRTVRKTRDISVLVLLDLSHSMNARLREQELSVLDLTRQVCVLFAEAIATVGDPFAIHGFCSESRHFVEYFRLKDFDQPYDDAARQRLAGMHARLATRMGAAIRHATHHLNEQKSARKLLMIITDGAPSDVDVDIRGRDYLLHDTRKAVEDAARSGINTYCINLDPNADRYVSRIFGARNYIVVDHLKNLPEKVILLYAGMAGH